MYLPTSTDIQSISTLITMSVAPVFLIAGVAGLLNVFTSRLTRIVDKLDKMDKILHKKHLDDPSYQESDYTLQRRSFLVSRMKNANLSIMFGALTGLMVALVIITVFLGALFHFNSGYFIAVYFILAMVFLICSLVLFLREIYFTNLFINIKKKNLLDEEE